MNVLSPHIALYRLFDVADEIDLGRLSTPRLRLSRARLGAVRFENPPGEMELGVRNVEGLSGLLTARLYEFGVVSLSFRIHLGERVPWEAFLEKGLRIPELPFWEGFFLAELAALEPHLRGALLRPEEKRLSEEFVVYHALGLEGEKAFRPSVDLTPLWMGAEEEFAPEVRREVERYRYSYSTEDLALLGFDRVLILDSEGIWDVADLVEFVHAQLLELSYYDRVLTEELELVPQVLRHRGLWGYTGLYKGVPVSVQTTGMGTPSAAIVVEELVRLGARVLVRVGTAGAASSDLAPGELIVAQGAVPLDGTTRQYLEGRPYAPVPDPEVFRALWRRAEALGYPHRVGLVASEDAFYATTPEEARAWARYGVLACEMEASALVLLGRMRGVRTGAILAVSNRIGDPELAPPEVLQEGVRRMVEVALEAVLEV